MLEQVAQSLLAFHERQCTEIDAALIEKIEYEVQHADEVHANQIMVWKKRLHDGAEQLFENAVSVPASKDFKKAA